MIKTYQKREYYLNKIRPFMNSDLIKVLVGQRRVGKSYIIFQLIDEIKKNDRKANIIYINKEDNEFEKIINFKDLIKYAESLFVKNEKNYLFVDEIQDIEEFEKALRHLSSKKNFDIYCSGSNADLMSSEIATLLSGRYIELSIHPLSYKEFLQFHKLKLDDESFLKYLRYGGLPFLANLELKDEVVYSYLQSIYNTIVLKDVVARFNIRGINFLNRLLEYIADNISFLVSANRISDFLKSQKTQATPNKVLDYLSHLCSSFIIREVNRIDVKGKKIFEVNEKYYWEDIGIRNSLVGYKASDIGKILENLIFNHLIRLGFRVNVGQLENKEVDFVAEKEGKRIYLQVAYLINDKKTEEREFGNLLEISDNYRKIVVSMDKFTGQDYLGVKHYHIIDFLLDDDLLKISN